MYNFKYYIQLGYKVNRTMKFVSFNINGLRAHFHQLEAIISILQPDIIGLQETKIHNRLFPTEEIFHYGYNSYYHGDKNHYGVALLSQTKPISIRKNFDNNDNNKQCRIIMADFITSKGTLTVINGYFPQGENRNHPIKFIAKKLFYHDLYNYIKKNFNSQSLLIIMGDMNISPTNMDIGIGEQNRARWLKIGKCSFLPEEQSWMHNLLEWGLVDVYRQNNIKGNKTGQCYSWFDYRSRGFNKNYGLRVDLILASKMLSSSVTATGIDYSIRSMHRPSDHAPVWADFDF